MPAPRQILTQSQLLVEGKDQLNFFDALLSRLGLGHIQMHDFGGINDLAGFLELLVKLRGFNGVNRLGIIRDAERSAGSALQSVQSALKNVQLPIPSAAGSLFGTHPSVGVMILPDNSSPGMLETLLCRTFAGSAIDGCIDRFFACVGNRPGVSIVRPDKARAQAWLATRKRPHLSVGVAAKAGYWNLNHSALSDVRAFLRVL